MSVETGGNQKFKVARTGFNTQGAVSQVKANTTANEREKGGKVCVGSDILWVLEGKFGEL